MKKTINFILKYKYILIGIILLVLLVLLIPKKHTVNKNVVLKAKTEKITKKEEPIQNKLVKVDVKGFVANPNVYELDENSRVIDAINAAGGLIEDANTELINLSQKVNDEMVIIVYSNKQIKEYRNNKKEVVYVEVEKCPDKTNDACINKTTTTQTGKVNINSATEAELTKISGVGASRAKDIIEHRNTNGSFNTIEDIKKVKGIGDALFEKIKDSITV